MDGTAEGLAAAAATREALKQRKACVQEAAEGAEGAKRGARPPPTCTHEVARPEGFEEESIDLEAGMYGTLDQPKYAGPMAKDYPFTLDPFQQTSIACLERRESVLVAAHTSAGKTVVAEYAIAMAFRDKQRVVYTSPIKALSNQKYRELASEFGDVGLMTGDVTLNPNASCIVMTTEILRAMIYKGSELLREVAWVIFDEVHYMQDRERGVVWEETIIFLEHSTKMVFLSATLSNASEFAAWVAHLHKSPCHVVFTDYRPTPLQHYAFPMGVENPGLFLIKDENGTLRTANVAKIAAAFDDGKDDGGGQSAEKDGKDGKKVGDKRSREAGKDAAATGQPRSSRAEQRASVRAAVMNLAVNMHNGKIPKWLPAIFFSFSKRECEEYARACYKADKGSAGLCFTTAEEQEVIETVFDNALQCLNEEDRHLRPVVEMRLMLKAGVGVHHGGLLPLMKEVVELLFQDGFIKMLFTTETFAMGLNMPARTVVFTSLTKWDGSETRNLTSGEYIQMSGRAGRRGKDVRGHVVLLVDKGFTEEVARKVMLGAPSPLVSSFKLSYYTLLNLMKRPEGGVQDLEIVIANSFQQFQRDRAAPKLREELSQLEAQIAQLDEGAEASIAEYRALKGRLAQASAVIRAAMLRPDRVMGFLRPGRLVHVAEGGTDWGWGVVVSVMRRPPQHKQQQAAAAVDGEQQQGKDESQASNSVSIDPASYYIVDVLLACEPGSVEANAPRPAAIPDSGSDSDGEGGGEDKAGASGKASKKRSSKRRRPTANPVVLPVALPLIRELSTLRVALPGDLRPSDARQSVLVSLQDLSRRFPDGLPRLDPIEDMGITDDDALKAAVAEAHAAEAKLVQNEVYKAQRSKAKLASYTKAAQLLQRAGQLRAELRGSALEKFREESRHRTAVMRRLGFVNEEGVVTDKGLAAACIDTTDELLSAELMFNGVFMNLDKHKLAALVSCLVFCERTNDEVALARTLAEPLAQLQEAARTIAAVSNECKVEVDPEEYVDSFRPTLMDVTYRWSQGAAFEEICKLTELYEGSIIRAMRRLDELLTQLAAASDAVGEDRLKVLFLEAQTSIRRDIVFAASLYL